jgi:NAD(P)-dependent dehydrogenase (short-subunit alcohol dehydrogenase family)
MNDSSPRPSQTAAVQGGDDELTLAVRDALSAEGMAVTGHRAGDAFPSSLNVLIHIAGDAPAAFGGSAAPIFADALAMELRTAFVTLQRGVAAIRAGGSGGSVVVVAPPAHGRAYDALRQGLRLLVRSAALELGPEDIRVNIVLPGAGEALTEEPVTLGDVAASVAFAASSRARFMTGADLVVDGGGAAR